MTDRYTDYTRRPTLPEPAAPLQDAELLGKVMVATVTLERDFRRLEGKVDAQATDQRRLEGKVDAQSVDLDRVNKTAQDFAFVKKIATWALGALLPLAGTGIVTLIQGHQRLATVEQDLKIYNDRSGQIQAELIALKLALRELQITETERKEQSELLKRLADQLDALDRKKRR